MNSGVNKYHGDRKTLVTAEQDYYPGHGFQS